MRKMYKEKQSSKKMHCSENQSIPELISCLKSADFAAAEAILAAREASLRKEIEEKERERVFLDEKSELCRLEVINVGLELKEAKRACLELKRRNGELKRAKLWAETESEVYKRRFEELEVRVSSLERDAVLFQRTPLNSEDVSEENGIGTTEALEDEENVSENGDVLADERREEFVRTEVAVFDCGEKVFENGDAEERTEVEKIGTDVIGCDESGNLAVNEGADCGLLVNGNGSTDAAVIAIL